MVAVVVFVLSVMVHQGFENPTGEDRGGAFVTEER